MVWTSSQKLPLQKILNTAYVRHLGDLPNVPFFELGQNCLLIFLLMYMCPLRCSFLDYLYLFALYRFV